MIAVKDFEGLYSIEEDGRVFSHRRQRYLNPTPAGYEGYLVLDLKRDGKRYCRSIHRLLGEAFLGLQPGQLVDHKDRNILNNSLTNLRVCSRTQNNANTKLFKNNRSGLRGVTWHKCRPNAKGAWKGQICERGKMLHLGLFATKEEAARAYNAKALELHGEFATLNPV